MLNGTDHSLGSVVRIVGRGALMRGTNFTDDDIDASDSYIQSPLSHCRALHSLDSRPEFRRLKRIPSVPTTIARLALTNSCVARRPI